MTMPRQGVVTATLTSRDGETYTFLAPATLCGDQIMMDDTHLSVLCAAMHRAGLTDAEVEFVESNAESIA